MPNFTVTPKASMWFGITITVLSAIGQGTLELPDFIPKGQAHNIVSACLWVSTLFGIISTALHGYSAPQPGPFVPPVTKDKIL